MKSIPLLLLVALIIAPDVSHSQDYLTCSRPSQVSIKTLRSPKYLRIKEKVIKNIPCDLYNQNYCNIPGELYPWHSVRRFVYENQGLIRRMYGEVRQLSVLRMEIDHQDEFVDISNSIDEEDGSSSSRQFDSDQNEPSTFIVPKLTATTAKMPESSPEVPETNLSSKVEETVTEAMTTIIPESPSDVQTTTATDQGENDEEIITTTDKDHIIYFADAVKRNNNNNSVTTNTEKSEQIDNLESADGSVEEQILQDEVKPILKAVNACPVKEEVVAPYWANSTRGEILALLNLYPFEQYIHWEKCNQEHKQMFCRNGCRCEQQYRLHRLLAFDPTNECRGIFSDWFRFPSCCVCKCYLTEEEISSHYRRSDLPQDSLQNNRSPRKMIEQDQEFLDFFDEYDELEEDQPDVRGIDSLHNNLQGNQHFFYQQQPR